MKWVSLVLTLAVLLCVHAAEFKEGDVIFNARFSSLSDLDIWSPARPAWASIVPGRWGTSVLNITEPVPTTGRPSTRLLSTPFNASRYSGYMLYVVITMKAINVSMPQAAYNGIKGMLFTRSVSGSQSYVNPSGFYGDFDWSSAYSYTTRIYDDAQTGSLSLGLQDSSGTMLVESVVISVFRLPLAPLPTSPVSPPPPFTGHPGVPVLRGVMSPQTYQEEQIQNLGRVWKANVIRWQLTFTDGDLAARQNLTLYDAWLNKKLNETDFLLESCIRNGIKVVLDLHTPPGGRDPAAGDLFLTNQTYQDHFFEIWRNLATRYKGHKALWGFDIQNEPYQTLPGNPGVLQWQEVAEKATALVRSIDPDTPIFISCEIGGDPSGFRSLRAVNDSKVVYQFHMYVPGTFTHQGVLGFPIGAVYPGVIEGVMYNITRLRSVIQPVRDFQLAYNVQIYVGEFSAIRWAANASAIYYLRDCITLFEEYGWDWSYHAYKEFPGWSVEYDENINNTLPVNSTARKELLLSYFARNIDPYTVTPPPTSLPTSSPSTTSATSSSPSSSSSSSSSSSPSTTSPSQSSAHAVYVSVLLFLSSLMLSL